MINRQIQQFLLKLARYTLEYYFETGSRLKLNESNIEYSILKEYCGTFVTLHKNGQLRGCIGHIKPVQKLYEDIINNTLSAAFDDSRFRPLQREELGDLYIEISILTKPSKLNYSSSEDLLKKLQPNIDGVILEKWPHSATYLPQVWEDFLDKEEFLSSLCVKAGLDASEWKKGEVEVSVYQAEVFGEKE